MGSADKTDHLSKGPIFTKPRTEPNEEEMESNEEPIEITHNVSCDNKTVGSGTEESLDVQPFETDREDKDTTNHADDIPLDSSENIVVKRKRPTRNVPKPKYNESTDDSESEDDSTTNKSDSLDDSESDYELSTKKSRFESSDESDEEKERSVQKDRSESPENEMKRTPQCVLCENGIFLICFCGAETRSTNSNPRHSMEVPTFTKSGTEKNEVEVESREEPITQAVSCENMIVGNGTQESLDVHPFATDREDKETLNHPDDIPLDSSENMKRKRAMTNRLKPKFNESTDDSGSEEELSLKESKFQSSGDSDEEKEPSVQKDRSESPNEMKRAPKCLFCKDYPTTARAYAQHLESRHKTTSKRNGITLICFCGAETRSNNEPRHSMECDRFEFSLHKTDVDIPTTPKCVLCENYPITSHGYVEHLRSAHNFSLHSNGIYLICSCGFEVHSDHVDSEEHIVNCDGLQYTLHKPYTYTSMNTTPKCVLCEVYPSTASGYMQHLKRHHKSTLKKNGIYLICSCGLEIRSDGRKSTHIKKCQSVNEFTLHKLEEH